MLPSLIVAALAVLVAGAAPGASPRFLPDVVFRPKDRAVSNWRLEGAAHLAASPGVALNLLIGREPRGVARCVRLNNYWCIKRAGWAGEIAADAEGHVAFASAAEGADVAALLLRRYYVDDGRHSALSIVSHWAPATCGAPAALPAAGRRSAAADHLATHGIAGTLRARFLAGRGRRLARGGRARLRVSAVPDRLIGRGAPAPSILAGGDKPVDLASQTLASLPFPALAPAATLPPEPTCRGDRARIAAYAARAAAGIAAKPTDDLKLFDPSGRPTPNLARVMRNMAAVEIGPLGARDDLIAAAVERASARRETAAAR